MKSILVIVASSAIILAGATGCVKSNPAQTKVYTPLGSVKYHCPPGQAKKGRCHAAHGNYKH